MIPQQGPSPYQPFLIAGPRVGMERDMVPFMLPNDAYPVLENFYIWRARLTKKGGTTLLGRLGYRTSFFRVSVGIGDVFNQVLPAFERGSARVYTTNAAGTTVIEAWQDNGSGVMTVTTGPGVNGTVNYGTSTVNVTMASAASVNIYASWQAVTDNNSPAMGLRTQESFETGSPILEGRSIGFDLLYAYRFNDTTSRYEQLFNYIGAPAVVTPVVWSGTNSDFFTSTNWFDAFWATNFVPGFYPNTTNVAGGAGDGIRWFADTIAGGGIGGWANFRPQIDAVPNYLLGARFLIPYKDRLLAINTWEGPNYAGRINFQNRIRWSKNGTPFYAVPVPANQVADVDSWRQDVEGKGNFLGIPTNESITGALIIRDDLIIYAERSKWRLVYTGNKAEPFIAQQIDTEFGCESPYSIVPMNQRALAVAYNGINETDGVTTSRIDELIPDEAFGFHNRNNGHLRVHGIRDYYTQFIYWTYTDDDGSPTFPNRTLVFNYLDKAWSIFRQQFTVFGYYKRLDDLTWGGAGLPFSAYSVAWGNPAIQADFPLVIGGNQHGYVLYLENQLTTVSDSNATSLSITNITTADPAVITVPNHGLELGQWIKITGVNGVTGLNSTTTAWKVFSVPSVNTITVANAAGDVFETTDVYTYGGQISLIDNFDIETKRFPLFMNNGAQTRLGYIDLLMDATDDSAEFTVQVFDNEVYTLPVNTQLTTAQFTSTNPDAQMPERIWRRIYLNAEGQFLALKFSLSDVQIQQIVNGVQSHTFYALILWAKPAARWVT